MNGVTNPGDIILNHQGAGNIKLKDCNLIWVTVLTGVKNYLPMICREALFPDCNNAALKIFIASGFTFKHLQSINFLK